MSWIPEAPASGRERTLILCTVPPFCGGGTLEQVLREVYGPSGAWSRFVHRDYPGAGFITRELAEIERADLSQYQVLMGHAVFYGQHRDLPIPATYLTMLRDPSARVLSMYYSDLYHGGAARDRILLQGLSFAQYAAAVEDNPQTRFFLGRQADRYLHAPDSSADLLLEIFEREFIQVCIASRFDDSLDLLRAKLGWTATPAWRPLSNNRGRDVSQLPRAAREALEHRLSVEMLPPEVRDAVAEHNDIDGRLVAAMSARLDRELLAAGLKSHEEAAT